MWKCVSLLYKWRDMTMEKPAIEGGKPVRETPIYYGHQYIDEADIQAVVAVSYTHLRAHET